MIDIGLSILKLASVLLPPGLHHFSAMNEPFGLNHHETDYRRLREDGGTVWTPGSEEQSKLVSEVMGFLAGRDPAATNLVEFGCGEAFLAGYLLGQDFSYTGIDLSPSAIEFAHNRYRDKPGARFILGDVTNLKDVPGGSFDAGLDILFMHMLTMDQDRGRYLEEVRRVLKQDGAFLLVQALRSSDTVEEITGVWDLVTRPEHAPADNRRLRVPARFKNVPGYLLEMERAGFTVQRQYECSGYSILHLKNI